MGEKLKETGVAVEEKEGEAGGVLCGLAEYEVSRSEAGSYEIDISFDAGRSDMSCAGHAMVVFGVRVSSVGDILRILSSSLRALQTPLEAPATPFRLSEERSTARCKAPIWTPEDSGAQTPSPLVRRSDFSADALLGSIMMHW